MYRTLAIIYNILNLIAVVAIVIMASFPSEYTTNINFIMPHLITIIILFGVNSIFALYFVRYYVLLKLLDEQDWERIMVYLEIKIYKRKKFYKKYISTLISAYILLSKSEKTKELIDYFSTQKPAIIIRHGLQLGAHFMFYIEPDLQRQFFDELRVHTKGAMNGWANWGYAFALMRRRLYFVAKPILIRILLTTHNNLLRLMTVYLLNLFTSVDEKIKKMVEFHRAYCAHPHIMRQIQIHSKRHHYRLFCMVISSMMDEALRWAAHSYYEHIDKKAG